MSDVGVRELKARASEIVRSVRDQRARHVITYRGSPVGVLMPLAEIRQATLVDESGMGAWEELIRLGEEIGWGWRSPLTGPDLLSGMRR